MKPVSLRVKVSLISSIQVEYRALYDIKLIFVLLKKTSNFTLSSLCKESSAGGSKGQELAEPTKPKLSETTCKHCPMVVCVLWVWRVHEQLHPFSHSLFHKSFLREFQTEYYLCHAISLSFLKELRVQLLTLIEAILFRLRFSPYG